MNAEDQLPFDKAPEPRRVFNLAVVGSTRGFTAGQVVTILDRAVSNKLLTHAVALVGGAHCPAARWALDRWYGFTFVPSLFGGAVARDKEIVRWANALLVFGNPKPHARIIDLARRANLPVHIVSRPG